MLLCLDIGNSQIFGGVLKDDNILLRFRHDSKQSVTSDQLGLFLRSVLRENNLDPQLINDVIICSVVPHLDYTLRSACLKYFNLDPFFLQAGAKTGLKIRYRNPVEVGADRIANAIAATHLFPNKNLIIVDFGTATTFCAISKDKDYLGGSIMAGIRLSMEALQENTAKLSSVNILKPKDVVGRSTIESIQSGLFYSQLASVQLLRDNITKSYFSTEPPILIGTGGFGHLFENENIFTAILPDLVLIGLYYTRLMNR